MIIQGKGYVSAEALQILAENNISVIMLDKRGRLFGYFNQVRRSNPAIREKQLIVLEIKSGIKNTGHKLL